MVDFSTEPLPCDKGIIVPVGNDICRIWCEVWGKWIEEVTECECEQL